MDNVNIAGQFSTPTLLQLLNCLYCFRTFIASETFQSLQFERYLSGIFSICPVIFLLQAPVMEQHSPTRSSSTPGLTDPSRGEVEGGGGCLTVA